MRASYRCLLTLFIVLCASTTQAADNRIKIGVSASLTGDGAAYGADVRNGIVFANEKFGQGRFELVIEDDRCNGKDAVAAAQKLVNIDRAKYVIGYACSGALLAAAPIFERAGVVTIGTATSAAAISQAGKFIFRTWPSDQGAAEVLYRHVAGRHKYLGVVTEETEFARGITDVLLEQAPAGEPRIINQMFLPGSSDFRSLLGKFKAAQVDSIFLNTQSEVALIPLYRQMLEMKWHPVTYANYNAASPGFLGALGSRADGIIFFDAPFLDQLANSAGRKLQAEFFAKYGPAKSSPLYVLTSMAGFAALAEAIMSGEDVGAYLSNHTFSHVIDNLSFDENGDPRGIALVLKVISDGRPVPTESDT